MKFPGFMLLLAGWMIALVAILLLPGAGARAAFMVAGVLVEVLGLGLLLRSQHLEREVQK